MSIASKQVKDLDSLIAKLTTIREKHGSMPVSVSVYQESGSSEFASFYEDREVEELKIKSEGGQKYLAFSA